MKKLFGLYFIIYLICVFITVTSCQKETISLPQDITAKKIYVQVVAYNSDGTSYTSEIELAQ